MVLSSPSSLSLHSLQLTPGQLLRIRCHVSTMPLPSSLEALKLKDTAAEHRGGEGVACELFELGLENFVVRNFTMVCPGVCGTDLFSYPFLADPRPLMILKSRVLCSNSKYVYVYQRCRRYQEQTALGFTLTILSQFIK